MWGFCGCNRRREEREVSPVRDMREFVEVRRPCNECKCHENRVMAEMNEMKEMKEMKEMNEVEPEMNERRGCGCKRNRRRSNNNMVSPAESSFCQRQLEAARTGCVANPLTVFNRCQM